MLQEIKTESLQMRAVAFAAFLLISNFCVAEENASNPLAAVNNTDGRFQYFDLGDADRTDAWIDGAYMATSKLKLKYELHYWNTNVTGTRDSDFDSFHFKPIYFPTSGAWGSWNHKWAAAPSGSSTLTLLTGASDAANRPRVSSSAFLW